MNNTILDNSIADISIVGAGVKFPEHLTLETIAILEQCKSIYTVPTYLSDENNTPKNLQKKIKSLWHLYEPDRFRGDNYKAIVETIIKAAYQERPIAYLASGNPVVFDSVTQGILKSAEKQNLSVKIFPAISSIDTILVDLKWEVAPGLQIYDATLFVGFNFEPRVDLPCLLIQISTFGTSYTTAYRIPKKDFLNPLKTYLMNFYPDNHQVYFICSSILDGKGSQIVKISLADFDFINSKEIRGSSLFIPPLHKPNQNLDFLTKLKDSNSFSSNYLLESEEN